ncbi:VOC family protein [Runella slithyformis]|uniref:Glyoxalase/bleomycin resistance protein/dioxygenase n=1 Tax=Runella slithyformis (strain ATCC 29530 / DSM 19594 / LMG 11500 / NCIMB 11436 / LSU 4) TaxID=761193 RepID=A0A7U3ZNI4_RUNSL|nr:VOC family protein [Runella slithyformis]AEI50464.1 Glyoxalase/bleomycin resistance protein/dioxygenase [Runella slithyformis DSM 19594]
MRLGHITILVNDYDEAIAYYTQKLGFTLIEDTQLTEEKRWVIVAPEGSGNTGLLLAKAVNEAQKASIGNQTGGRVFLFLYTPDFWLTYKSLQRQNVDFAEEPRLESYGWVVVFQDLYGNKWDLLEDRE